MPLLLSMASSKRIRVRPYAMHGQQHASDTTLGDDSSLVSNIHFPAFSEVYESVDRV